MLIKTILAVILFFLITPVHAVSIDMLESIFRTNYVIISSDNNAYISLSKSIYPTTMRIKGRTATAIEPNKDQFFAALTGNGGHSLIEVYRQYTNRKVVVQYGINQYNLGVVDDATDFDFTLLLKDSPEIDRIYLSTDAIGEYQWDGVIHKIEIR